MFGRRRTTIHNEGIPAQINNGNTPLRPSKSKMPFSFRNIGKRQTIIHPDMPQLNIEIANKWIENPLIDPYTNETIVLSIHPKSGYVKLYKKIIDELIKELKNYFPRKDILTIEDCKYIRNNLPIIHSVIIIDDEEYKKKYEQDYYIKYDHLFIKYFVKRTRKYKYDSSYREDSEIKLYLNIYNSIKTKEPPPIRKNLVLRGLNRAQAALQNSSKSQSFAIDTYTSIEELLINNMDFNKTDICIGNLVINLCIDIRLILYMHKSKINIKNYNIALNNKKALDYVALFYKLDFVKDLIYNDILNYYNVFPEEIRKGKHKKTYNIEEVYYIYRQIIDALSAKNINDNDRIFKKFIKIYDIILSLYNSYFTKNIDPSIPISIGRSSSGSSSSKKDDVKIEPYAQYCPKDAEDPITLKRIRKFNTYKRKYVVNILSYNKNAQKKVIYYCFDTIKIYNYILSLINEGKYPKNPNTNMKFIDEEIDEICNKIKYFTKQPTYNSHIDIKYVLDKKRDERIAAYINIKNDLVLSIGKGIKYDEGSEKYRTNSIIGEYNIYISINLEDILLPIINTIPHMSKLGWIAKLKKNMLRRKEFDDFPEIINYDNSFILRLPIFKEQVKADIVLNALAEIGTQLKEGTIINDTEFPYRKDNKDGERWNEIMVLPPFNFDIDEDADVVLERFKEYKIAINI